MLIGYKKNSDECIRWNRRICFRGAPLLDIFLEKLCLLFTHVFVYWFWELWVSYSKIQSGTNMIRRHSVLDEKDLTKTRHNNLATIVWLILEWTTKCFWSSIRLGWKHACRFIFPGANPVQDWTLFGSPIHLNLLPSCRHLTLPFPLTLWPLHLGPWRKRELFFW